jgi:DNA-binding response OmpR family regulator
LNESAENRPFVALIDDDQHSAHLLTRMLLAHGAPDITWYGDANAARTRLTSVLADPATNWPGLIVVDLKAHSKANLEFIASIQPLMRQKGVLVVAMVQPADLAQRDALQTAGSAAVFVRHAEREAYRREAANIVSFWARSQRLDAVGM